jgi:hypothetical protein
VTAWLIAWVLLALVILFLVEQVAIRRLSPWAVQLGRRRPSRALNTRVQPPDLTGGLVLPGFRIRVLTPELALIRPVSFLEGGPSAEPLWAAVAELRKSADGWRVTPIAPLGGLPLAAVACTGFLGSAIFVQRSLVRGMAAVFIAALLGLTARNVSRQAVAVFDTITRNNEASPPAA